MNTYTLVVEKWQVRPEPKWVFLKEEQVEGDETAKRIKLTGFPYRGRVFDKQTGREVVARGTRRWYKYTLRQSKEQAA